MTVTYDKIATTTLGSATNTINFTSISGSYTDLILVCNIKGTSANVSVDLRFNSDTGNNYSTTFLSGNGSAAQSARLSNVGNISTSYSVASFNNVFGQIICQIQNYANTNVYKTVLIRSGQAGSESTANVGLWRNTAAITAVNLSSADNYATGSTFTLYGIKAE